MNTTRPTPASAPGAVALRKVEIVHGSSSSNRAVDTKMAGGAASRADAVLGPSLVTKEEKKKIVLKQEVMHQVFYR